MNSFWMQKFCSNLQILHRALQYAPSSSIIGLRRKSYYVTTPIFYVNSVPHLGHLYTATLADASCRWQKLKCAENVTGTCFPKLVSGTDEHGEKVMLAALANKKSVISYCDTVSCRFEDMMQMFEINCYDFIRTTEERHTLAVEQFWKKINDNGFIYKGSYEGWYSTSDETFVNDWDVEEIIDKKSGSLDHVFKESGKTVKWTKEYNYKFRLTKLLSKVRQWIIKNPDFVYPAKARKLVLDILDEPLTDLSISRDRTRVPWGIQVPDDPTQTIYVWMDALINYLTVAGYPNTNSDIFRDMWPADCHVVGIDIVKFHAIYWPAFLMAAGLELPKQILVHSHWTVDNLKMSKSTGNVVDPFDIANKITPSGLRYFLLKQGVIEHNCNYAEDKVFTVLNSDLANDLGNCLHRAVAKHLNPDQTYPPFHKEIFSKDAEIENKFLAVCEDIEFVELVGKLPKLTEEFANSFHFYNSIAEIMNVVRKANQVIHRHQLWTLDQSDRVQLKFLHTMLHCVYEGLRVCGILLQPFVPELADTILNKLNICKNRRTMADAKKNIVEMKGERESLVGLPLGKDTNLLYKRLKQP